MMLLLYYMSLTAYYAKKKSDKSDKSEDQK